MARSRKQEIVETLKAKGIDPLSLERKLVTLLRRGETFSEVRERIRKMLESEKK